MRLKTIAILVIGLLSAAAHAGLHEGADKVFNFEKGELNSTTELRRQNWLRRLQPRRPRQSYARTRHFGADSHGHMESQSHKDHYNFCR